MKLLDPARLCETPSAAPALNRGLAALVALGSHGSPFSLDTLASALKLPKASLFRLLETLQQLGLVRKTADKCYEALWTLQPLTDYRSLYRQCIESHFPSLCEMTGCTVEWYEPTKMGMVLIRQMQPDSELRVQAKPGFLREWGREFEAVARLGYAFANQAPEMNVIRAYVTNGVCKTLTQKEARRQLEDARTKHMASDMAYNVNGVRRCGVAVFDESGHVFLGVLALAEVHHFSKRPAAHTFLRQLTQTLNT